MRLADIKYTHGESKIGGCPLCHVVFDQINRAYDEKHSPFWIPIPDDSIGHAEGYHICSVDNLLYMLKNEGKFKISASRYPNPKRMRTGIKGINSGGGVLVKIAGNINADFNNDASTVVSHGHRWIMARQLAGSKHLIDAIRDLRSTYLDKLKRFDRPWHTYRETTLEDAASQKSSWTYFIGAFWNRNNTNDLDHWMLSYLRDLFGLVETYKTDISFSDNHEQQNRTTHDELIFGYGWNIDAVIAITRDASNRLKDLGISFITMPKELRLEFVKHYI